MKKLINSLSVIFLFVAFLCSLAHAQTSKKDMEQMIDQQFKLAANQYKILEKNVPDSMMPKTVNKNTGKVESSNTKWWCSGFFPAAFFTFMSIPMIRTF